MGQLTRRGRGLGSKPRGPRRFRKADEATLIYCTYEGRAAYWIRSGAWWHLQMAGTDRVITRKTA